MIVKQKGTDIEHVKVLDFGIAKILDDDGTKPAGDARVDPITSAKSLLTRVGTIVGTPAYMAPEQGRAEQVDGRTDLYACGVLLYELVTGRVPFSGETPMQVVMRHVNEAPQPPSTFLPVDPALEEVIMRALKKFPAERQQSATELADALAALLPKLAKEKRQPGDSSGARIIIGDPPKASAPAPARAPAAAAAAPPAAHQPATRPVAQPAKSALAASVDDSTLVLDGLSPNGGPANGGGLANGPSPRPAAGRAAESPPAFPTLNIDVPEDILDGIQPKHVSRSVDADADADSDDVRTLIAKEAPVAMEARALGHGDHADDDPRTVVAPPRGASIPDLSTPIAFSGAIGAPSASFPKAPTPAPVQPKATDRDEISTTLVSAAPDTAPQTSARSSGPKPPGTTALGALKGTAKLDPTNVKVSVAAASTVIPTTKPSPVVDMALAATQRIDNDEVQDSVAAARASLGDRPGGAVAAARERISAVPAAPLPLAAPKPTVPAAVEDAVPEPFAKPKFDTAPAVVWEPKRKKLSGPVAMALGILIGALLFGFVLLILKMAH